MVLGLLRVLLSPSALGCCVAQFSFSTVRVVRHYEVRHLRILTHWRVFTVHHSIQVRNLSILFRCLFVVFSARLLLHHFCRLSPILQVGDWRKCHSLSSPAENWDRFIEADPHVHLVHTTVHV